MRTCFPTIWSAALAFVVCIAVPFTLVGIHIHENPLFSPLDEAAHYDYVNRIADGSIPVLGQPQLPSTLRAVACTGSVIPGGPSCSQRVIRADQVPGGGLSYEAQQPPGYYAITVPFRWLAVHVAGLSDLSGTRAVGGLWLAAGLLLLWAAGRVMGLDPKVVGAGVLLVAVSPVVVYESSIVSNTASMVFAGSLVALASALAWRRPGRWVAPTLFGVGILAVALKETGSFPVLVASILLAMYAYTSCPHEGGRLRTAWRAMLRWLPNGGAMLIAALLGVVAWTVTSQRLALIDLKTLPSMGVLRGYPVDVGMIAKEALLLLLPATADYAPFRAIASTTVAASSLLSTNLQQIIGTVVGYLFLGGAAAGAFVRRRQWYHWMGLFSIPVVFVGGLVMGIGIWLSYNADPGLGARYGLSLLPFMALALVAAVRGRFLLGSLWAFAAGTGAVTLYFTLVR